MGDNNISPSGTGWSDYRKVHYTIEEQAETDIRVALIGEIIVARKAKGLTQKQLEQLCGVKVVDIDHKS